MSDNVVISLENVSKVFKRYQRPVDRLKEIILPGKSRGEEFWALKDISFEIQKGETVGIIGRNGAGKSTLLQIIAGTLKPTIGNVEVNGRVAALLELGSGFNPEFTGHQNIFFNGRILGLTQEEIESRYEQIVEFADIGDFIHQPVKTYSSGMFVRLAFAVQANIDASIVIIDEALAVGDIFFRQKCYARLDQLRLAGAAILLVSHSMPDIQQYCKRAILLDRGIQRFLGLSAEATKHYYLLHQSKKRDFQKQAGLKQMTSEKASRPIMGDSQKMSKKAWLDLTQVSQITNGQASCTGVAICDVELEPCNIFHQSETAILYYKFKLNSTVDVPICGIVIKNDRGIIVHGKNSWQYAVEVPLNLKSGEHLTCKQEVKLNLQPGEYTFDVGLASIPLDCWENRQSVSHQDMASSRIRVCHLTNVSRFSVTLAVSQGVETLTHYGVADLPGKIDLQSFS